MSHQAASDKMAKTGHNHIAVGENQIKPLTPDIPWLSQKRHLQASWCFYLPYPLFFGANILKKENKKPRPIKQSFCHLFDLAEEAKLVFYFKSSVDKAAA